MANERLERFTNLLKEIFELDKSDLDFGIYRIINLRKAQIEQFLTQRLPQMVEEILEPFAQGSKEKIQSQMKAIEAAAADMGRTIEDLPETLEKKQQYIQLQKQLAQGADLAALETDVYSALYSFFSRYYDEGDFISKRRYKKDVYAIPYEGEEVKLYWANQDQYYIKTSENFKDYTFTFDRITVHFRLVDATTEQNNNKENKDSKRTFMLFTEDEEKYPGIKTFEYNPEAGDIIIRFVYDIPEDKKRKYAEENYEAIKGWLDSLGNADINMLTTAVSTGKGKETPSLLEKHLKGYVAKNTFDYFIHKDLRGFLMRELDFFIKSEIMHLEDLDTDSEARVGTYLAKVKAIKRVGRIIIDFLAQIENFQKKLWLKKKFVVETNWCITLDKIDESFWPEIIRNKAQINEWITMYAVNEANGWTNPPTVDFLRQNKNLVIDTKLFSDVFKYTLLESIQNLDEQTNGLMIHSENYHALNLIQLRYSERINCCYYDPPYNTSENTFFYKNGYRDSSWASMIADRINISTYLLCNNGVLCTAIDDKEFAILQNVLDIVMGYDRRLGNLTIEMKPSGRTNDNFLATSHEYILFYGLDPSNTDICFFPLTADQLKQYNESDETGMHKWRDFIRTGGYSTPEERPNSFYPIYFNEKTGDVSLDQSPHYLEILPIDTTGKYRVWRKTRPSFLKHLANNEIKIVKKKNGKGYKVQIIDRVKIGIRPKSVWVGSKYDASAHGTKYLQTLFGDSVPFSFPKSIHSVYDTLFTIVGNDDEAFVLDIFAGSGTTGEAVINLNRDDGGKRKYILVEMGEYFNMVTLPRMKKVIYATEWKNGKPQTRNTGTSQIIKYMQLESYEDALSNIQLSDNSDQFAKLLREDYLIHYLVDLESRDSLLNVEAFANPFSYTMKITEKNECKVRPVDLVETFNYLIGLTIDRQTAISYWLSKPAEHPAYERAVDLVSDISGPYAFRQVEGTLPDGRRALVIWRSVTDDIVTSNAALDAYFTTYRKHANDRKYDVIFVNGDNNLENLRGSNESWKVQMTEIEFKNRMFEEA